MLIEEFEFDPRTRTCTISLVAEGSTTKRHTVVANDIRLLRFFDRYTGSGQVVETTEVYLERQPNGLRLVLEFWGPDAGMEIEASEIQLNGSLLG